MKNKFRIVKDNYAGFEVQIKRWYYPVWEEKDKQRGVNSFQNIELAKKWIDEGCPKAKAIPIRREVLWESQ